MATGAYGPIVPFSPSIIERGTSNAPEAAGQDFKAGVPLVFNGGSLEEAGAAPTAIAGISVNAASGVTGKAVEYWPVNTTDEWEMTFDEGSAFDAADRGAALGILEDAGTHYWYGSTGDAGAQFYVHRLAHGYAVGDSKPRVIGKFATGKILAG
jgi:hypothetical protein